MDCSKNLISNHAILSLFAAGFILLYAWNPLMSNPLFSFQKDLTSQSNSLNTTTPIKDELEEALSKAATATDKTVIITIVNKAYVEPNNDQYPTMFDLFLEGFWIGEETKSLLDHLLVVAIDQTAYDRCKFRRLNCYRLLTNGLDFTDEKFYMSKDFIKMMWTRTLFLLDVLKHGYNFIFTVGLCGDQSSRVVQASLNDFMPTRHRCNMSKESFSRLRFNDTEDLQISTDHFNGNPWSETNPINTGFYYIRANNNTISLFQTWYATGLNSKGLKEQDVLGSLIRRGVTKELGLKVRFLDNLYFSGFCKDSKDVRSVVTVHANCCRTIRAKVADLTAVLKDWRKFKQSTSGATEAMASVKGENTTYVTITAFRWSIHDACFNSWRQPSPSLP